jgi:hypothetical protein
MKKFMMEEIGKMKFERGNAGLALLGDMIYIIGGVNADG